MHAQLHDELICHAGMKGSHDGTEALVSILEPALLPVLDKYVLRHLTAAELFRLGASCRPLYTLVMATDASVWRAAATKSFSLHYPAIPQYCQASHAALSPVHCPLAA